MKASSVHRDLCFTERSSSRHHFVLSCNKAVLVFFYLGFFLQGVEQASAGAGGQAGGVPTPSSTDCRQQVPVSIHYKVETLSHSFSCLWGGGGGGELRVIVRSPTVFLIVTTSD